MGTPSDFWDKLGHTTQGLTTLEINTILKSNMNANKISDNNRNALYQLAGTYAMKLDNLADKYEELAPATLQVNNPNGSIFRPQPRFLGGGVFSFREIGICAEEASKWLLQNNQNFSIPEDESDEDYSMLKRIESKCYEISNMLQIQIIKENKEQDPLIFKQELLEFMKNNNYNNVLDAKLDRLKQRYDEWITMDNHKKMYAEESKEEFLKYSEDIELSFKNRLQLHKAYDIGLEEIMLQTRIELDGDITTRISKKYVDNPIPMILDMHNLSVNISVAYWNKIFDVISSFFTKILSKFNIG